MTGYDKLLKSIKLETDDGMWATDVVSQTLDTITAAGIPIKALANGEMVAMFRNQLDALGICTGCGHPIEDCGPKIWKQQKKCCPDCSHVSKDNADDG